LEFVALNAIFRASFKHTFFYKNPSSIQQFYQTYSLFYYDAPLCYCLGSLIPQNTLHLFSFWVFDWAVSISQCYFIFSSPHTTSNAGISLPFFTFNSSFFPSNLITHSSSINHSFFYFSIQNMYRKRSTTCI